VGKLHNITTVIRASSQRKELFKSISLAASQWVFGSPNNYIISREIPILLSPELSSPVEALPLFYYVRTGTTCFDALRGFFDANTPSNSSIVRFFVSTKKK
jgi:hypothetical protein